MIKYLLIIVILVSCSNNNSANTETVINESSDNSVVKILDTAVVSKRVKLFDNQKPFTVTLLGNRIERNSTDKDTIKCNHWSLTQKDVLNIIKNSKPIDGTLWDLEFDVLSCSVYGTIIQNNIEYPFTTNSAAYSLVNSGDTTIIYGDYKKQDKKLFLSFPGNE